MTPLLQPLWTSAIATTLVLAPLPAIATSPAGFVEANRTAQRTNKQVQAIDSQALFVQMQQLPLMAGVNITQQQASLIRPIFEQTRARIGRVLTPEQQNRFHRVLIQEGRSFDEAVDAMELSAPQKAQLDNILQMTGLQIAPLLTSEQRDRIQANLDAH